MMPKHSLRAPWARLLTALAAVSLLTVSACSSDSGGGVGGSNVVKVDIVTIPNLQSLVELIPGNTRQFLGVPTNSSDNWVDKPVTWASSNAAVASVDATTGLVTAVAGGSAFIRATAGGRTDSVAVAVRFPVGMVTINPAVVNLRKEGTLQLTTTLLDTQGATVTGRTITWTSSVPTVAAVSATGLVSASVTNEGATTITATAANASDGGVVVLATRVVDVAGEAAVATIAVTGGSGSFYGDTQADIQLTATPLSGLGNPVPGITITWSSTTPATATVSGTGLVDILAVGTTNIRAQAESFAGSGVTITGTRALEIAQTIVAGANVIATLPSGESRFYALLATAADAFTLATDAGTTGDMDMAAWIPSAVGVTFTASGGAAPGTAGGRVCNSGASGNSESCAITPAVSGWYRVGVLAWTNGTSFTEDVTGVTLTYVP